MQTHTGSSYSKLYDSAEEPQADNASKNVLLRFHEGIPHHSAHFEEQMSLAISEGDYDKFLKRKQQSLNGTVGLMSTNAIMQARYSFVCAIFTISRAAIKGGVSTEQSFQLSDTYCQKMDKLTTVESIYSLLDHAVRDYCDRVKKVRAQTNYTTYTKIVLEYIRTHLCEPIRMEDLVREASLNKRSLSIYFKQDMGCGIPAYITAMRMEEARVLLANTTLSLVEISEMLCFSNQSHFGKIYKSYWHTTPHEYRKSLDQH